MDNREGELCLSTWEYAVAMRSWSHLADRVLKDTHGVTITQFWVLLMLEETDGLNIVQMVEQLELGYTTVAECVYALERRGLLAKSREGEGDRRLVSRSLTPAGLDLFRACDKSLANVAREALDGFDDPTRRQSFQLFYLMMRDMGKTRWLRGMVRGDTAFIVACVQVSYDFQAVCRKFGLSPLQGMALLVVREAGEVAPKQVADMLLESPSNISKAFSRLKAVRLSASYEGASKREVRECLTDEGVRVAHQIEEQTSAFLERRFGEGYRDNPVLCQVVRSLIDKRRAKCASTGPLS